jgi:hypothetical protein
MSGSLARVVVLAVALAAAGCRGPGRQPAAPAPSGGAAQDAPAAAKAPAATGPGKEAAPKSAETTAVAGSEAVAVAPPEAPAPAPPPAAEAPAAKPQAKGPAQPAPGKERTGPAQPAGPPPLDLDALERRLKDTEAIGVFTKLTLKNQVDDLLERFEAHYGGTNRSTLAELRQPYDLLMLKVLSLLQDRDAPLASAILQSREAIWKILSDPAGFRDLMSRNRS